ARAAVPAGGSQAALESPDEALPEGAGSTLSPLSLLDLLTAPQRRHPRSLFDQLQAAVDMWAGILGPRYGWLFERARRGLDQLLEERPGRAPGFGPPPQPSGGYWAEEA